VIVAAQFGRCLWHERGGPPCSLGSEFRFSHFEEAVKFLYQFQQFVRIMLFRGLFAQLHPAIALHFIHVAMPLSRGTGPWDFGGKLYPKRFAQRLLDIAKYFAY